MKEQESISRIAVMIYLNVQFSTPYHEKCKETGKYDPYTKETKQATKVTYYSQKLDLKKNFILASINILTELKKTIFKQAKKGMMTK